MPAENVKQRGPYKRWKYDGSSIPRSTRHSRLVSANSNNPVNRNKPIKRLLVKKDSAKVKLSVKKTLSNAQKENIPCSNEETPEPEHTFPSPASPDISVSADNTTQREPTQVSADNTQCEDFSIGPMIYSVDESIGDDDSENGHVVESWHVVNDAESDNSCDNFDEDSTILHECLNDTEKEPEDLDNQLPVVDDPDSEDSDDSEEMLDRAPGLHLNVTEKIKLLLLLATKKRHKLTYTAAEDILELAGVFSDENPFVLSRHVMKSAIEKYSFDLVEHHMCPSCGTYIGVVTQETFHCNNCNIETSTAENKKNGTIFLYLSLRDQLKALLESLPEDVLIDPKKRSKISSFNYEDIFDGAVYKLLSSLDIITLNFFIDGVPVCTTSKQSAWPILITVNELPLMLRRKHVLMASIWLSKKKPVVNEYLKPFVAEMSELAQTGVSFRRNGTLVTLKVKACCCISDSIARPMIRNSKQFNGKFGCGFCYHPGVKLQMGRGHTRSYTTRQTAYRPRTHEEVMELAALAELRGVPQRGIKGRTILSQLPDFDVVRCIDLDSFHAVVNVAKRFCDLWFKAPPTNRPVPSYKIHNKLKEVDERLLRIKPTEEVSRTPRSLADRSDYRGHEWFYFVVFYSVPVLKNILAKKFLNHWSLFVKGLAMYMQNSIAKSETVYADRYLQQFVAGIDCLYGPENVTFCCHLLTHLRRSVEDFAQPFTHSGFLYEGFNYEIKEAVQSSHGAAKQIIKAMQLRTALIKLEEEVSAYLNERQQAYLDKVNLRGKRLAAPHMILDSVSLLGKPTSAVLSRDARFAVSRAGGVCTEGTVANFYERCKINGEIFHATSYSKVSKRNNCVVLLESGQVFVVDSVVVISGECFILGYYYQERKNYKISDVILPHIRVVKSTHEGVLRCVRPAEVVSKLINFSVDISSNESLNLACINVLLTEMLS